MLDFTIGCLFAVLIATLVIMFAPRRIIGIHVRDGHNDALMPIFLAAGTI